MRFLFSFLFFATTLTLFAQENLVSNGSFELMDHCGTGSTDLSGLIDVSKATNGTVDIWSEVCGTAPIYLNNNIYKSKDGVSFSGICSSIYWPPNYGEYLQLKLKVPLVKDKFYEIGCFVKAQAESGACYDCIEFHLSTNQIFIDTIFTYPFSPNYSAVGMGQIYCDTINWVKVSGLIKANGNEQFLVIGCFKEYGEYNFTDFKNNGVIYLFIDSVYIAEPSLNATFPNVITPNGDNNNDVFEPYDYLTDSFNYELKIYNRWGNLVYDDSKPWSGYCNSNKCHSGVYYYIIDFFKNNEPNLIRRYKGTVTLLD